MKVPALILARGGSKGVPRKNLREVGGRSLVGRIVSEAVRSPFDPVIVWSDSQEIRDEAAKWGAEVPVRPQELAGDTISTEDSVKAFLELEDPGGQFAAIAVLQCTTPFLRSDHLGKAMELYASGSYNSVVSVCRFDRFLGYPSHDGKTDFIPLRPYRALRQQGAPRLYMENGGIYLATRALWMSGRRIGNACGVVEMGWWESLEVDEPEDLEAAMRLSSMLVESGEAVVHEVGSPVRWVYHSAERRRR